MKKVSELIGWELDYWVAKAEGLSKGRANFAAFSERWAAGGPIIEREKMDFNYMGGGEYEAYIHPARPSRGKSMLEAGMRCYVTSKFGDTVDDSQTHNL